MSKIIADKVSICNMALRHLGQSAGLVDFDNDQSAAGDACRTFYDQVIDEFLEDFPWTFATQFASPALVQGPSPQPTPEWPYSYRLPTDCLFMRRILPVGTPITISIAGFPIVASSYGGRFETQESRVAFRLTSDDVGMLILTDFPPISATTNQPQLPMIEYIKQQDDQTFYPPNFAQGVAAKLAFYMAPSLTGGDKFKLGDRAFKLYIFSMAKAVAREKDQEQPDMPVDSEFIRSRG
ncbi:MAG TPA: hypothetical protein VF787_03300 [Thermoanaerobaculia bacterium]